MKRIDVRDRIKRQESRENQERERSVNLEHTCTFHGSMHDDVACICLLCLRQICKKTAERTELQASATEERTDLLLADSLKVGRVHKRIHVCAMDPCMKM